ncbi:hypothetical protein [Acidisoma sp.]|uniref:hypothetical protein n=1 Tax=Acidisoma sp. TaxID=1872115 RepID=UPI003B001397
MRLALGLGTRPAGSGQPSSAASGAAPASHDSVRQRRRFAQDGDVPVVMLHRGRDNDAGGENKVAALTADLREERSARQKSERALDEANVLISSLKTKLKHAEMSLEEKSLHEGEARAQWDALLAAEREARQQAETRAAEATLALSMLERKVEAAAAPKPVPAVAAEPAAAPAADLFGDTEVSAAAPVPQKRRMTRKPVPEPEVEVVAATVKPQQGRRQVAEQPAVEPVVPADDDEDKPIEWWLPSFRAARKTPVRRKRTPN